MAVGPDQIGLVAADNRTRANHRFKFRAIGASSSGLHSSFAARTVGDWNQLPAVVEQESPAAFKNQLDRLAPVACCNAPPPAIGMILHEEVCQLLVKTRQDYRPVCPQSGYSWLAIRYLPKRWPEPQPVLALAYPWRDCSEGYVSRFWLIITTRTRTTIIIN